MNIKSALLLVLFFLSVIFLGIYSVRISSAINAGKILISITVFSFLAWVALTLIMRKCRAAKSFKDPRAYAPFVVIWICVFISAALLNERLVENHELWSDFVVVSAGITDGKFKGRCRVFLEKDSMYRVQMVLKGEACTDLESSMVASVYIKNGILFDRGEGVLVNGKKHLSY